MSLILGAYAAADPAWTTEETFGFYARLADVPTIGGLELPVSQVLALLDRPELAGRLPTRWRYHVTTLPATMPRIAAEPGYGLASLEPEGRAAALDDVTTAATAAARLDDLVGEGSVSAVVAVSAPRSPDAAIAVRGAALADSLRRLADRNRGSASLIVEHCDATSNEHEPAKGFLPLDAELDALDAAAPDTATMSINWARSAIERRDSAAVVDHIVAARARGRLGALIFSGCAATSSGWGAPWADTHLPPAGVRVDGTDEHASLMDADHVVAARRAAGPDTAVGVKVSVRPRSAPTATRLDLVTHSIDSIAQALRAARDHECGSR